MAGRGRGRGKTVSFDIQVLGFGRGEALPAASLQPPPLFPPQEFKPVPLIQNDDYAYMFALKQEFRTTFRKSPFYLKALEKKKDIERYSDKYQLGQQDISESWTPDWSRFPAELKIKEKKERKLKASVKPNLAAAKKHTLLSSVDVTKTLETLEKKEGETVEVEEEAEKKEEKDEDDDETVVDDDEVYDEEDLEEETDYAMSYFDNGEGYGDDDDGDEEGPVY